MSNNKASFIISGQEGRLIKTGKAISPGHPSKTMIELSESLTAREAALKIIDSLLGTAEKNAEGIKNDIGTDFIHDFRVSLRRLRTLMGQFKQVFPKDTVDSIRNGLSSLGRISNSSRDLDVYLARKSEYMEMLPKRMRPHLDVFFKRLDESRKKEFGAMQGELDSETYKSTMATLHELIKNSTRLPETRNSREPAKLLASRFILKKFKNIILDGSDISDETSDNDIHRLRISCKHLRYLIEFFSSLFPCRETSQILRQMKQLQDRLGAYNDLSVQQRYLNSHIETYGRGEKDSVPFLKSLRNLIAELDFEKDSEQIAIVKKMSRFCSRRNIRKFKQLFSSEKTSI